MFNLIKMDLYRMVHSVSFKVMMVVVIAVAFFTIGMTSYDVAYTREQLEKGVVQMEETAAEDDKIVIEMGISVTSNDSWVDEVPFSELVNENMKSNLLLLLCAIFVPLFVHAEYKNGYIKNIAGQLSNRGMLVVSKLVAVAVQILILFVGYIVWAAVAGMVFFKDTLVTGNFMDLLGGSALHYLLCLAVGYVVLMLTLVTRSSALPLTFGVLCSTGFTALLYSGINMVVSVISGKDTFDIGLYTPEMNVGHITFDMTNGTLMRVLIVGCVYAVLAAVIAVRVMKKRDV
ncbi:MAG: hypothetical protein J6J42_03480 [Lachnospiraceae bacterium]|nr:hypothetical protein [Lachnospiraceae bacterium]